MGDLCELIEAMDEYQNHKINKLLFFYLFSLQSERFLVWNVEQRRSFRWQRLPVQPLSVPVLAGGDGRNPAESAVSRDSVASSWRLLHPLHTPPPWLWVGASSAIGGLGDKAFFSLLRPLEGNHLPFETLPPPSRHILPQLGLKKCLNWYRPSSESRDRIAGRERGRKKKKRNTRLKEAWLRKVVQIKRERHFWV